jgi:hypothetical protein
MTDDEFVHKIDAVLNELSKSSINMERFAGELKVLALSIQHQGQTINEHKINSHADIVALRLDAQNTNKEVQRLKDSRTWIMAAAATVGLIVSFIFNALRATGIKIG